MSIPIIVRTDVSPVAFRESVTERITESWEKLVENDPRVFNGTLLRVVAKDAGSVTVAPDIGYREVVGLRAYNDFQDWISKEEAFQVLSVIAFVETLDGHILLMERNSGDWEHSMELLGGFVPAKDIPDTVEAYISARVALDLGMSEDVIKDVSCIGHVEYTSICESMYVCKIMLTTTFEEIGKHSNKFFSIPEGYTTLKHHDFFPLPLHGPSGRVLDEYLETARGV